MGVFDSHADSPEAIRIEGEQITIRFDRTGPTTGRVSWNIPPPAAGCTSDTQAYCGMLVTLDTQAASVSTAPVDDTIYTADPTADTNLHAGDTIGTSLVIGAFYEGEKKGTGQDLTTFFDISGLDANTPYFISGYAVDCVGRYHTQGVFAYSQNLGNDGTPDTSGSQTAQLNGNVTGTSGTGLLLGETYDLNITIDGQDYVISVDGTNAQTYDDLVAQINNELKKLSGATQSAFPPNQNAYWYDANSGKLFQWDGSQDVEIPVLNEPTDPTALTVGDYWYDTANDELNQWDGSSWVSISNDNVIRYKKDPTDLNSTDYWYQNTSPSKGYQWCGNVWCEKVLYDQTTDPTLGATPNCGSYWYNSDDGLLRQWDDKNSVWQTVNAIYWNMDPSSLSVGTLWFNDGTDQQLYSWNGTFFDNVEKGYQDVILGGSPTNAPYGLASTALAVGTYTEDVLIAGNTYTINLEICNAKEGQFGYVFAEINKQLAAGSPTSAASVGFRADGSALRLLGDTTAAPQIQPGGNLFSSITDYTSLGSSINGTPVVVGGDRPTPTVSTYWVDTENEIVELLGGSPSGKQCSIFFDKNPTDRESCDLWWNSDTDILNVWDAVGSSWIPVSSFVQSTTDPAGTMSIESEALWYNSSDETMKQWDGSQWLDVSFIAHPTDPTQPAENDYWWDTTNNLWYQFAGSPLVWTAFNPVESVNNPSMATIPTGTFWYDTMNNSLFMWNGTNWVSVMFGTQPLTPATGDQWYDTTNNILYEWNGTAWVEASGPASVVLVDGNLVFTSSLEGSLSSIILSDDTDSLLASLSAFDLLLDPVCGTDGLEGIPSTQQLGVGTDGSSDEKRKMADDIRRQLGYPTIDVELDKEQVNIAIDRALTTLRQKSGSGTRRGFMKLPIRSGIQMYQLTNKGLFGAGYQKPDGTYVGYDSIVQVMGVFRTTSAFMTSAHGSGVFGQVVLQHLYNMGTFDLLSYHLVSQYIEQLEHLFASRLTFNWNETDRVLWLHQAFAHDEMAIMDVAVERTEQDLLQDRFTKRWIERWALAESRMMLAEIRGKYASLPGAGGGISLNASDLMTTAKEEFEALQLEIDNYQVNNAEEYGMHSELIIG